MEKMSPSKWYTIKEAKKILRCKLRDIERLIEKGDIRARSEGGVVYVYAEDVHKVLKLWKESIMALEELREKLQKMRKSLQRL